MLAQEVALPYGGKVRFVVEDLGASKLAESFGVEKYPAIFVGDALVARPEDFFAWNGPETGKYLPWSDASNRRKFQADLKQMIDIALAGGRVASLPRAAAAAPQGNVTPLPDVALADLEGRSIALRDLRGKPLLIEFWAPWCPHCLRTLSWMKTLDPAAVGILAIAIESPREDIERAVRTLGIPGRVVLGSAEVRAAFGGPPAIPTLILADADGSIRRIFYGAPPSLHDEVAREIAKLRRP